MKLSIAIAAALGVLSLAACTSNAVEDEVVETEIVASATVLDITGMT